MKKKQQKIQIILISIGLLLILITYFYYPYMKEVELVRDQPAQKDLGEGTTDDESTFFENVEYKGLYDLNKPFTMFRKVLFSHIKNKGTFKVFKIFI